MQCCTDFCIFGLKDKTAKLVEPRKEPQGEPEKHFMFSVEMSQPMPTSLVMGRKTNGVSNRNPDG